MTPDLARRIKLFRLVRDIPYRIGLALEEPDYCCSTKTPLLQRLMATLGLESRRICCRFRWEDTALPRDLVALAPDPESGHEYLEVLLPEKKAWVAVDPSWDIAIASTGLPVAAWDGSNSTVLAVTPVKTFSPKKSAEMVKRIDDAPPAAWQDFFDRNRVFFTALNGWLEHHRARDSGFRIQDSGNFVWQPAGGVPHAQKN